MAARRTFKYLSLCISPIFGRKMYEYSELLYFQLHSPGDSTIYLGRPVIINCMDYRPGVTAVRSLPVP